MIAEFGQVALLGAVLISVLMGVFPLIGVARGNQYSARKTRIDINKAGCSNDPFTDGMIHIVSAEGGITTGCQYFKHTFV